jgi:hypothetical protein
VNYFDIDPFLTRRARRKVLGVVAIGLFVVPGPTNRLVVGQIESYAHELAVNATRSIESAMRERLLANPASRSDVHR